VSEVERWRNAELAAGVSGKSANLGLGVLRAALNAAKRRGEILHNPCDAVANVAARSDEREPFTDSDVAALLRAAKETDWQGAVLAVTNSRVQVRPSRQFQIAALVATKVATRPPLLLDVSGVNLFLGCPYTAPRAPTPQISHTCHDRNHK
jgi:hypothetical protein